MSRYIFEVVTYAEGKAWIDIREVVTIELAEERYVIKMFGSHKIYITNKSGQEILAKWLVYNK